MFLKRLKLKGSDKFILACVAANNSSLDGGKMVRACYLSAKLFFGSVMLLMFAINDFFITYLAKLSIYTPSLPDYAWFTIGDKLAYLFVFMPTLMYFSSKYLAQTEWRHWASVLPGEFPLLVRYHFEANIVAIILLVVMLTAIGPRDINSLWFVAFYLFGFGFYNKNFLFAAAGLALLPTFYLSSFWFYPEKSFFVVYEGFGLAGAILTASAYAITLTGAYRYKVFEDSADAFILALLASAALAVNIALYCGIALSPGWGILGKKTVINDYDVHIANIVYLVLIASAILSHRFLLKVKGCAMYRMTCLVFILINMVLIVISVVNIHGFTMFSGLTTLVVFMVVCFPVMWIATGKFKFWEGTGQRIKDSATDDAQGEAENFFRDLIE